MSKQLLVGIDMGTSALKVAVFDTAGKLQASATREYSLLTPANNIVETPPHIYMDAIKACFRAVAEKGVDTMAIAAIGFSAQSETLFFVDAEGRAP